jgi:ABC-type Na+ transport system ATPase subunit NatA
MNIMTIESENLYLQVDTIKEHLDMADNLYDILNQKTQNYDFEVLSELTELKQIIYEEKEQFSKGKCLKFIFM